MNIAPLLCAIFLCSPAGDELDFDTQIVPILTKAGCNSGACHGAAAGRGGFHLSLLGADAELDYGSIVHQFEGRRVNLRTPSKSLLLTKPTGFVDHGGDYLFDAESPEAKRLRDWITVGAPRGKARKLTRLQFEPSRVVVELGSEPIPLRALASFDDGPVEDVTRDVLFTSNDPSAIEVDQKGPTAKVLRSGQLIVIARYIDRVIPIEFLAPRPKSSAKLEYSPATNLIDEQINRTLSTLRIPASKAADDATFLRRVSLDLTGKLPTTELAQTYSVDTATDKRVKLVDELLAGDAFNDYWTYRFARALQLHSLPNDKVGVATYANWLKDQIRANRPLNEVAAELLTATGDSHLVGPANFTRMVADARGHAELVGKVFMGVRLGCANCHNHPLDRWTQDDFHGFAAVFAKLDRDRVVKLTPHGAVTNLRTGEPAIPRIPGERFLAAGEDPRLAVANSLANSGDRQFARAIVNRLWHSLMGRGFVEPIDDMRETNPPSHPVLLAKLANDFAAHGYDIRHLIRVIVLSDAYGRDVADSEHNRSDDRFYSHAYAKPMLPEVLVDAVADVLQVESGVAATSSRAIQLIDPLEPSPTLDLLGRCNRPGGCVEGETRARGLAAQLHILNGDFLNAKLADPRNRLSKMLAEKKHVADIVREFYLAALCREPIRQELANWHAKVASESESEQRERLEDFVWSLLSSQAFTEIR